MNPYEKHFQNTKTQKTSKKAKLDESVKVSFSKDKKTMSKEDHLVQNLKKKLRRQRRLRERSNEVPLIKIVLVLISILGLLYGYLYADKAGKIANMIKIDFLTSASAVSGEKSTATKEKNQAKAATAKGSANKLEKKLKNTWTDEDLNNFSKLNERKLLLDAREAELESLERELHKQKLEIEKRITKLESVRRNISSTLKKRVSVDKKKVEKLVGFYSSMKPAKAAKIISDINEDLAVEILSTMKKKSAAQILDKISTVKAQALSEKFAGYKRR